MSAPVYTANPSQITKPDGSVVSTQDPLGWLFHECEKGADAVLASGDYPAPLSPIKQTRPSRILGVGETGVRIKRATQDTFFFADAAACGDIRFENLLIEASWRSAVMFMTNTQPLYFEQFHFANCWIDGGWDFAKKEGFSAKWGLHGNRTSGFSFIGGGVKGIRQEHAFYFHNTGPLKHVIRDCSLSRTGRTLIQVVGRVGENGGSPSQAAFELTRVKGESAGLADGGSAFTFSGQQGPLIMNQVEYEHGFAADLAAYKGTGALVLWPEYGNTPTVGTPNGDVYLVGCRFRFAPTFGKAPVCQISAVDNLVVGSTTIEAGWNPLAVDLNPTQGGMAGALFPVKEITPLAGNVIKGKVAVAGTVVLVNV